MNMYSLSISTVLLTLFLSLFSTNTLATPDAIDFRLVGSWFSKAEVQGNIYTYDGLFVIHKNGDYESIYIHPENGKLVKEKGIIVEAKDDKITIKPNAASCVGMKSATSSMDYQLMGDILVFITDFQGKRMELNHTKATDEEIASLNSREVHSVCGY